MKKRLAISAIFVVIFTLPLLALELFAQESSPTAPETPASIFASHKAESSASTTHARALPSMEELVRLAKEKQKEIDKIRKNYICDETVTEIELDGNGGEKSRKVNIYESFFVDGESIMRLINKEGKPLDDKAKAKEEKRVDEEIRKAHERAAKRASGNPEKDEITVETLLKVSAYSASRLEIVNGEPLIVIDFHPAPGYQPKNLGEKVAHLLSGSVWIDPQDYDVTKLEARLVGNFNIGWGMLASLKQGAHMVVEQKKINNEIWMPTYMDANLRARVLFSSKNAHELIRYDNYRKFGSHSTIQVVGEVQETSGDAK